MKWNDKSAWIQTGMTMTTVAASATANASRTSRTILRHSHQRLGIESSSSISGNGKTRRILAPVEA